MTVEPCEPIALTLAHITATSRKRKQRWHPPDTEQWLGVDCLWLLPMYASPLRDGGYDISDYYSILPEYGTLDDFKDFLDAAQYPELSFVGKRVQPRSGPDIDVVGDLTIKGITREVVLSVEQHGQTKDPWGNVRAAFTAKTSIDRKDFGLTWNQVLETGGVMVGDRVDIEADIEAVKQVAAQVA